MECSDEYNDVCLSKAGTSHRNWPQEFNKCATFQTAMQSVGIQPKKSLQLETSVQPKKSLQPETNVQPKKSLQPETTIHLNLKSKSGGEQLAHGKEKSEVSATDFHLKDAINLRYKQKNLAPVPKADGKHKIEWDSSCTRRPSVKKSRMTGTTSTLAELQRHLHAWNKCPVERTNGAQCLSLSDELSEHDILRISEHPGKMVTLRQKSYFIKQVDDHISYPEILVPYMFKENENIVRICGICLTKKSVFIIQEYAGQNLRQLLGSKDFLAYISQNYSTFYKKLLTVLYLLRGHRISHNDIKPENICAWKRGSDYIPVLIDFESAYVSQEEPNPNGQYTPEYLPPIVLKLALKGRLDTKDCFLQAVDFYAASRTMLDCLIKGRNYFFHKLGLTGMPAVKVLDIEEKRRYFEKLASINQQWINELSSQVDFSQESDLFKKCFHTNLMVDRDKWTIQPTFDFIKAEVRHSSTKFFSDLTPFQDLFATMDLKKTSICNPAELEALTKSFVNPNAVTSQIATLKIRPKRLAHSGQERNHLASHSQPQIPETRISNWPPNIQQRVSPRSQSNENSILPLESSGNGNLTLENVIQRKPQQAACEFDRSKEVHYPNQHVQKTGLIFGSASKPSNALQATAGIATNWPATRPQQSMPQIQDSEVEQLNFIPEPVSSQGFTFFNTHRVMPETERLMGSNPFDQSFRETGQSVSGANSFKVPPKIPDFEVLGLRLPVSGHCDQLSRVTNSDAQTHHQANTAVFGQTSHRMTGNPTQNYRQPKTQASPKSSQQNCPGMTWPKEEIHRPPVTQVNATGIEKNCYGMSNSQVQVHRLPVTQVNATGFEQTVSGRHFENPRQPGQRKFIVIVKSRQPGSRQEAVKVDNKNKFSFF